MVCVVKHFGGHVGYSKLAVLKQTQAHKPEAKELAKDSSNSTLQQIMTKFQSEVCAILLQIDSVMGCCWQSLRSITMAEQLPPRHWSGVL
jgi:hypothetical protein